MSANIRAHLLVGRLQLQDQRMTALGAQLAGGQQALDAAERERVDQADRLADLQNALSAGQIPADEEQAIRQETARMKTGPVARGRAAPGPAHGRSRSLGSADGGAGTLD